MEKALNSTGRVNNVWIAPELLFYEGGRTREARKSHTNRHFNRSELQCVQRGPEHSLFGSVCHTGSVERDRKRLARGKYAKVIADLDRIEHEEGGRGTLELDTGRLDVTNLGKVFFPKSGHTKGDLMRFYATVAPYLLPAIADRPLVLKRFPNGIHGMAFYQQKAPAEAPKSSVSRK